MTTKAKCKLLHIAGAVISFAAPAVATVVEFPRVEKTVTDGGRSLADILNLSAAAFAIITILLAVTCWRFIRNHIKMPRTGLPSALILFAVCYGLEHVMHSFVIICGWLVIGCFFGMILNFIADRIGGEDE